MVEVRIRKMWVLASGLVWACGGSGNVSEPAVEGSGAEQMLADGAGTSADSSPSSSDQSQTAQAAAGDTKLDPSAAKSSTQAARCTPKAGAEPKLAAGEDRATEVADTGRALHFDVAGISVELPACTPEADMSVMTVSWETEDRPISSHIDDDFARHAATVRMDQPIEAAPGAPLLVTLHSHRELSKPGQKLVLAVEHSGPCEGRFKRDKLEWGDCSHWQLHDAKYDADRKEMVAEVPAIGGYRMQFGWMPKK